MVTFALAVRWWCVVVVELVSVGVGLLDVLGLGDLEWDLLVNSVGLGLVLGSGNLVWDLLGDLV